MSIKKPLLVVTTAVVAISLGLYVKSHSHKQVVYPSPDPPVNAAGVRKIQHVVFLIKENRSFDTYFGTFPGADGATSGKTSDGKVVPLR